jgi:hypothetical protein
MTQSANPLNNNLSAASPARLAAVMVSKRFPSTASDWFCQRDRSPIAMILEGVLYDNGEVGTISHDGDIYHTQ